MLISGVLSMYLPVTISGYMAYGSGVNGNVLLSLPNGALRVTAEILILLHVMCAFVINLNPFSLDMEELFHIPHSEHIQLYNWYSLNPAISETGNKAMQTLHALSTEMNTAQLQLALPRMSSSQDSNHD